MADSGIKKVTIPKNALSPLGVITGEHVVRYRIVSEDRNRVSSWSPIYKILTSSISGQATHSIKIDNDIVNIVWNTIPQIQLTSFDVYIRWIGPAVPGMTQLEAYPWSFLTTVSATSYSVIKPTSIVSGSTTVSPTQVQVSVQVPTYKKARNEAAALFTSTITNL